MHRLISIYTNTVKPILGAIAAAALWRSKWAISIGIMILLIVAKAFSENVPAVRSLEERTYEFLQRHIVASGTKLRPDVLVINIAEIKPERDASGDLVTPREPLRQLIDLFTELGASAVGIDIDFSPENGRFIQPDDPTFFDKCMERAKNTGSRIVLGVYRTANQPHDWLGDDRYMRLAGAIAIQNLVNHDTIPHWIRVPHGNRLPSMSAALAGVDVAAEESQSSQWSWAVRSASILKAGGFEAKQSLIDYSPLKRIKEDMEPLFTPESFRKIGDKIKGRIILLGDAQPEHGDMFKTPAGTIPGVLVHACGANTIMHEPLYQLTAPGRFAADFVLGLVVFVLVALSCWLASRHGGKSERAEKGFAVLYTAIAVLFVLAVSIVSVDRARLLWTDFVLVCAVLLVQLIIDIIRVGLHPDNDSLANQKTSSLTPAETPPPTSTETPPL